MEVEARDVSGVSEDTTNSVWDTLYATDSCVCANVNECDGVGGSFDTSGLTACGATERCLDWTPTPLDDGEGPGILGGGSFAKWQRLYVCEACG